MRKATAEKMAKAIDTDEFRLSAKVHQMNDDDSASYSVVINTSLLTRSDVELIQRHVGTCAYRIVEDGERRLSFLIY